MGVRMLNIHEAKTKLSTVLMQIEKTGDRFVICRNGTPIARNWSLEETPGQPACSAPDVERYAN